MDNRTAKYLEDILIAITEIESFFETIPKMYDEFERNILLRRGIERNVEIIGEAVNKILKNEPTISITNARKIVDTRNLVIHAYDSLTLDIIWGIVINHLPKLKMEVQELLKIAR